MGKGGTPYEKLKICSDFGQKDLDCFHLWVKFSIQNVVLRVSTIKSYKMFLWWANKSYSFILRHY